MENNYENNFAAIAHDNNFSYLFNIKDYIVLVAKTNLLKNIGEIYDKNKLFESLDLCKAELLNGVPEEDQVDLILGFLSNEKIWLNMIIEYGEENFLRLYENDKKIRKKCLNDMEVEEKMLYYHADTILDKMWKTNSYIVKQQEIIN